jgi:hypothetical protein
MKTALIVYWSNTGNTEKVAKAIEQGLKESGMQVKLEKIDEAEDLDYFDYDLVCVGCPSYSWHPPEPMTKFLKAKFNKYRDSGKIKPSAPKVAGKNALIFVTYSGPHTGLAEATPVGKDIGQYFEHIGFNLLDEWYILSEFHGSLEHSTQGRLGDVRGKPSAEQLLVIKDDAKRLGKLV